MDRPEDGLEVPLVDGEANVAALHARLDGRGNGRTGRYGRDVGSRDHDLPGDRPREPERPTDDVALDRFEHSLLLAGLD